MPVVIRGPTKLKDVELNKDNVEKLLNIPKLAVEPGFKNRAPLQLDEKAKDLIQEALKNPICITTEDLLNVSEPMRLSGDLWLGHIYKRLATVYSFHSTFILMPHIISTSLLNPFTIA